MGTLGKTGTLKKIIDTVKMFIGLARMSVVFVIVSRGKALWLPVWAVQRSIQRLLGHR